MSANVFATGELLKSRKFHFPKSHALHLPDVELRIIWVSPLCPILGKLGCRRKAGRWNRPRPGPLIGEFRLIMSRYDLTDFEWRAIEPLLPNKPRGVPRVDDRRVLNGIFWVLRSDAPWRDLPERYGPRTTCYNRFVRWRKAGVWAG